MSTYLELCQKLRSQCINGYASAPTTVSGQTGILERVVTWVADSWRTIQLRHDWTWARKPFKFNTVASTAAYADSDVTDVEAAAVITRLKHWWVNDRVNPPYCYLTSGGVAGQRILVFLPYEVFHRRYKFGVQQSMTGAPIHITVNDNNEIELGPTPDAVYTVTGHFQRSPQILALDDDEPEIPEEYHDLIVCRAVERYATRAVAPEVLADARLEGGRLMRALERQYLPRVRLGAPLR